MKKKDEFDTSISLGVDYSYKEVGLCISTKEDILYIDKINFEEIAKAQGSIEITNDIKRWLLRKKIQLLYDQYKFTIIFAEAVRLYSHGFVSRGSIGALTELVITIVDATVGYLNSPIPVYVIDTRAMRNRVVKDVRATKDDMIKWAWMVLPDRIKEKRDHRMLTDNEADAMGISKFAHVEEAKKYSKRKR